MSSFHSRVPYTVEKHEISAWLDRETGPLEERRIGAALSGDPELQAERVRLEMVRTAVGSTTAIPFDIGEAQARVRHQLTRTLASRPARSWWRRQLVMPVPTAIASAVAIVVLAGLALQGALPGRAETGERSSNVADLIGEGRSLNLQVNVDGAQTEGFLRWLDQQEKLQTVTIQLPTTEAFQILGEPVIRRRLPEGSGEEFEIVPLDVEAYGVADPPVDRWDGESE